MSNTTTTADIFSDIDADTYQGWQAAVVEEYFAPSHFTTMPPSQRLNHMLWSMNRIHSRSHTARLISLEIDRQKVSGRVPAKRIP